ncbi:MAG: ABC transporter permease [Dehalococcoidales bacterium]|nr:ABC transporter permease [Dehalococcoidales bacterium]
MIRFIISRLIQTVIILFIITLITFALIQIVPGDPALTILGVNATPEQVNKLKHEMWLDRPILIQYGHWLDNIFHGDFGESVIFHEKVTELIATRLPVTAYLSVLTLIISIIPGILAGIIAALRRGSNIDSLISLFANMGVAVPQFWLGILGIYILGLIFGWLPMQGFTWPTDNLWLSIKQSIMPIICLAIPGLAVIARQTRSSMLEIIQQDYIRTAWSKGLAEKAVILKHALKNALIPVVTLIGIQVRFLIGGSVIVETVFGIPGMGRLLVRASFDKDFLIVQAGVLVIGALVCLVNLLVDISYGWIDPRIKYE